MHRHVITRGRRAFTLLEILIVVGIIAMLAAFVVPNLMQSRIEAEKQMTRSAIESNGPISSALKLYNLNMGSYPPSLKELTQRPDNDEQKKWAGPYIEDASRLKDPWGEDYQYLFPSQHRAQESANHSYLTKDMDTFDLWSKGPDRQDGTDDDITNWFK